MRKIVFSPSAFDDLQKFGHGNQKLVFKLFEIISDIKHSPFKGIGKPEPLKGKYQGLWSRRINDEHRIVYKVSDDFIEIESCHGHY